MLRGEVVKVIGGESTFTRELLATLIGEAEEKCGTLEASLSVAQRTFEDSKKRKQELTSRYHEMISWSDMYQTAGIETKKMIVNCLIRRVDVYEGYRLKIDFGISLAQFGIQLPTGEIEVATA